MPTIAAMYGVKWMKESPPSVSTSRISSVAYATDESASLAKTGSAIFLGSSVSPRRSLRTGRPTTPRFSRPVSKPTARNATRHVPGKWLAGVSHG